MYTILIEVVNRYGEVETREWFTGATKSSAARKASTWCKSGWGSSWKELFVVRKKELRPTMSTWELR